MKEYKLNGRYWFFLVLFSVILILGIRAEYLFITGQVLDENGEKIGFLWSLIPVVVITPILILYLISIVNMLRLLIKNKGCGLEISDYGIKNTAVVIKLFAFVLILPVKCIPWESVKYYDNKAAPYIRVNTKQIQAGFLTKNMLKILGYNFCYSFVKPDVTHEDIDCYLCRFL